MDGDLLFDGGDVAEKPEKTVIEAWAIYNEMAHRQGWQTAEVLTKARRVAIKRAISDYGGIHGWRRGLDMAARSNFINGKVRPQGDRKQFRASIDWLCRPVTIPKILEGFYGDDTGPAAPEVKPLTDVHADDRVRLRNYRPGGFWPTTWGERPENPGCRVAAPVLREWRAEHGITARAVAQIKETPEERLRGMIAAYRRQKMWVKANQLEQQLAGLTGMPPVEVEAPPDDKPGREAPRGPVTDVVEYDGIPEGEDFGGDE